MKRRKSKHRPIQRQEKLQLAKNRPPAGSRPGTLVIPPGGTTARIRALRYTAEQVEETTIRDERELKSFCGRGGILWVDVQGLGDRATLEWIGAVFELHPLVLSDIVHVPQRPKSEAYGDTSFVVARRLQWKGDPNDLVDERQVSLVVAAGHVLSFHEREDDVFDPVRARFAHGPGLLRSSGTDYLAYALLDAIVDEYLPIMDQIGELLGDLEERVVDTPSRSLLSALALLRGDLITIRRDVWPLREALHALQRGDVGKVSDPVKVYLRDVHDHCVQVAEMVEVYREIAGGLLNLYLTSIANRTNEVMKVLTIVSTVFIPLTFLVGIYGMNFEHMPEIHWPWAYPLLLLVMLALSVAMLFAFRRKGWLGQGPE